MIKVVFVCLGNICRSPMAEGLFSDYVEKQGLGHLFKIESKATSNWEIGNRPHKKTLAILEKEGIKAGHMRASRISEADFKYFDYIIAMDSSNVRDLNLMSNEKYKDKIHLLIDGVDIPDPYYTNDFKETYDLITSAIARWVDIMMKRQ